MSPILPENTVVCPLTPTFKVTSAPLPSVNRRLPLPASPPTLKLPMVGANARPPGTVSVAVLSCSAFALAKVSVPPPMVVAPVYVLTL